MNGNRRRFFAASGTLLDCLSVYRFIHYQEPRNHTTSERVLTNLTSLKKRLPRAGLRDYTLNSISPSSLGYQANFVPRMKLMQLIQNFMSQK